MTTEEGRLGELLRTCRDSRPYMAGKPGTYGYRREFLLCTLPAGHPGDSHLCDEGDALSSWDSMGLHFLRKPRRQP